MFAFYKKKKYLPANLDAPILLHAWKNICNFMPPPASMICLIKDRVVGCYVDMEAPILIYWMYLLILSIKY